MGIGFRIVVYFTHGNFTYGTISCQPTNSPLLSTSLLSSLSPLAIMPNGSQVLVRGRLPRERPVEEAVLTYRTPLCLAAAPDPCPKQAKWQGYGRRQAKFAGVRLRSKAKHTVAAGWWTLWFAAVHEDTPLNTLCLVTCVLHKC